MKPWLRTLLTWTAAALGAGTVGGLVTTATAPTPVVINPTPPAPVTPPPIRVVPAYPSDRQRAWTAALLAEHNKARAARSLVLTSQHPVPTAHALAPLRADDRLICSATLEAADNAQRNTLDHFGAKGSTPRGRAQAFGFPADAPMSENIAEGTLTAAETTRAFIGDKPHAENVFGDFDVMGGAMWRAADGTTYWSCDYGRLP